MCVGSTETISCLFPSIANCIQVIVETILFGWFLIRCLRDTLVKFGYLFLVLLGENLVGESHDIFFDRQESVMI